MRDLRGRRVLVTGAARGIGLRLALRFAREGAEIVLTDLREDALPEAAEQVAATGAAVHTYPLDVTSAEAIAELRQRIHQDLGPIDVLVNNAGVVFGGAFLDVPWEQHQLTYGVNTLGMVAMTHAFLPDLIERQGHLVNIASASGFVGLPYGVTYASSKWGAVGFSDGIRLELKQLGHNVGVTTVCPSYVDTGMFAGVRPPRSTRMLRPDELADLVVRAVARNRPFVLAPWLVHTTLILRGILPFRLFDRVAEWFGVNDSMRPWRGHQASAPAEDKTPVSSPRA